MTIVQSSRDSENKSQATYKIVLDATQEVEEISDVIINSNATASSKARKVFLYSHYSQQMVSFETPNTGLGVNDIITISAPDYKIPTDLSNNRFIVKRVDIKFSGGEAMDVVQAVRYD